MWILRFCTIILLIFSQKLVFSANLNPEDPYETINRQVFLFNRAFDATMIRPPVKLYQAVIPPLIRKSISNFFSNIATIPTIANDLLQAKFKYAIRDSWRLYINTTVGIGGLFDMAEKCGLPPHYNDLGITLALLFGHQSPYIVVPLLGPTTFRDGVGSLITYALFTPYVFLESAALIFGTTTISFLDLRSQLFETEKLMKTSLDPYSFTRDAYLQHRKYLITGKQIEIGSLYVEDDDDNESLNLLENDKQMPISANKVQNK